VTGKFDEVVEQHNVKVIIAGPAGPHQGLTLAHFRAQHEDLRDTSLTLELTLSTCGTHPQVELGYMGHKGSSS